MSISIRQHDGAEQTNQTTNSFRYSYFETELAHGFVPIVAGDTLVALIASDQPDNQFTVTDENGNTWVQVPGVRSSNVNAMDVWYAENVKAVPGVNPNYLWVTVAIAGTPAHIGLEIYEIPGRTVIADSVHSEGVGGTVSLDSGVTPAVFLAMTFASPSGEWPNDDFVSYGYASSIVGSGSKSLTKFLDLSAVALTGSAHDGSGEPLTRNDAEPGDARTIQFVTDWPGAQFEQVQYHNGDQAKLSASVAKWHVDAGRAVFTY